MTIEEHGGGDKRSSVRIDRNVSVWTFQRRSKMSGSSCREAETQLSVARWRSSGGGRDWGGIPQSGGVQMDRWIPPGMDSVPWLQMGIPVGFLATKVNILGCCKIQYLVNEYLWFSSHLSVLVTCNQFFVHHFRYISPELSLYLCLWTSSKIISELKP